MTVPSVKKVAERGMCCGCGACAGVCPVRAVSLVRNAASYLVAAVDERRCVECGKCVGFCPASSSMPVFEGVDPLVGVCLASFVGHAADDAVRRTGQSGGMASALLSWLLDAGRIDGDAMIRALDGAIAQRAEPDADYIILSRIDNDDAYNVNALGWIRDVVERVAENESPDRFYVVMPYGNAYIEKGGFTQDYTWDWNHFPTLVCRRGVVDNPFSRQHARIGSSGIPVYRVDCRHAWLEIVNGTNVTNDLRVYCRPQFMSSRQLQDLFAIQVKTSRLGFALFWLTRYLPARIFGKAIKRQKRRMT